MEFDQPPWHEQATMRTTLTGALRLAIGPARLTPLANAERRAVA